MVSTCGPTFGESEFRVRVQAHVVTKDLQNEDSYVAGLEQRIAQMEPQGRARTLAWLARWAYVTELRGVCTLHISYDVRPDVNRPSDEYFSRPTPVIAASFRPCLDCLKVLVSVGADYCAQDAVGNDPVIHVVRAWCLACLNTTSVEDASRSTEKIGDVSRAAITYLIGLPARCVGLDVVRAFGWTPLMQAASFPCSEPVVRFLLAAGANPNVPGLGGCTALACAASTGDVDVVRALLGAGADPGHKDEHGHTAGYHAQTQNAGEVMQILASAGGK